jgi:hypothetical protein
MASYNNVSTSNGYQEFKFAPAKRVTIAVSNAPILAQFALAYKGAGSYDGQDRDMQNGVVWTWDAEKDFGAEFITALQVKSEIANTPAVITIHA